MLGRTEWRVRTRFREIRLRTRAAARFASGGAAPDGGAPGEAAPAGAAAPPPVPVNPLLADLLFAQEARDGEVVRVVREVIAELRGLPLGGLEEIADLRRELETAVGSGALRLDEVVVPVVPPMPELQSSVGGDGGGDSATGEGRELTFIGINLRDQDDVAIPGRRFRIQLPDGEVREGFTGLDGRARVDGIEPGNATITLPSEISVPLSPEEGEDDAGPFEILFVDENGSPIEGLEAKLVVDGEERSVSSGADGLVQLEDLDAPPESLELTIAALDASKLPRNPRGRALAFGEDGEALFPAARVEVKLVDDLGKPLDGIEVVFDVGGKPETVTTGPDGVAALPAGSIDTLATVRLASADAVRDRMREAWDAVRDATKVVAASDKVKVLLLGEPGPAMTVKANRPLTISVQPSVLFARLRGLLFETNKWFLLPSAVPDLAKLKAIYDDHQESALLLVGHTDTKAGPSINDPLSLKRAQSMAAFLKDDADAWLAFYGTSVAANQRWGPHEDQLMLDELTARGKPAAFTLPQDRRDLIAAYMDFDGTTLPADVDLAAHGCGENFPVDATGDQLDPAPASENPDDLDRRVEMFFFDKKLGVQPKPPGDNSKKTDKEYPEWRRRAVLAEDIRAAAAGRTLRVRLVLDGAPLKDEPYEVLAEGAPLIRRQTDADGGIDVNVPGTGKTVEVRIPARGLSLPFDLVASEQFPAVDDLKGVQIRLKHLGFFFGPVDGNPGDETDGAVTEFKRSQSLTADADIDDATRSALVSAYGI